MDKNVHSPQQATDTGITPIKFWGNIVIAALGLLANIVLLRTALQLPDATISYVAKAFHSLVILATSLVILLTIRGRQKSGAQVVFYTAVALFASGSFLYAESVLSASFSLLIIATIIISQLLPKESRRRAILMTGIALMITWTAAWINPSWRLPARTAAGAGLAASILFALILAGITIRLSWNRIVSSIRIQITLLTGLLVVIMSSALVTYSIITSRQAAIASAETEALAVAEAHAGNVKSQVAPALDAARTLAYSLGVGKDPVHPEPLTRDQANAILRKVAEENPTFLGTWTIWEPNAFDGLDAQFANTPLHDSTGRFIPYWVRVHDSVRGEAVRDYETPGLNDFYNLPRQTKQETIIPPFFYQVGGEDVLMTSLVVPIMENDRFYGVTGVDIQIDFVQGIVDEIDLYDGTATAVLMTDTGTLIAVRDQPDQALHPATSLYPDFEQIQPRIAAGETFTSLSPDGQYLRVFSPIYIGETGSHSSLGLIIPFSAITASATTSAIREVLISVGILTLALLGLWYMTGLITRPILNLTGMANTISGGNLNAVADADAPNEIGALAKAFNAMTSQLRNMLDTLEQRVAARTRNLVLAAEVGRAVSQVRDLDVMLQDACELILKEFNLYYVQVYLTDPSDSNLKLEAGTGSVGAQLTGRGHSLPLNASSINGRAAVEKNSVVIPDTTQSATFRQNPLLPETRGEMAVPLIVADKVVGVLDMQSREPGMLNEEVLPAFEALAGQLAVAIQNANLLKETNEARAEVEKQARRLVRQAWDEHLDAVHMPEQIGFKFDRKEIVPFIDSSESSISENAISSSISVSGEPLGSLTVQMDDSSRKYQAIELVKIISQQMAQQIENLRLIESAERYRQKAELAVRRTMLEGRQEFVESRKQGKVAYRYDTREVQPIGQDPESASLTLPIKTRDQAIGKVSILGSEVPDSASLEIVNTVVERLGNHVESLRQYDQTQSALAQSEKLFDASSHISQATTLQELVAAVVTTLDIPAANRALLTTFHYGESGDIEQLTIIGNWWNGTGHEATPVGTRYSRDVMRVMSMFISPTPVFFDDVFNDKRVDPTTMELVAKRLNLRSVAVLPLYSASRQIGALVLEGEEPHTFTQEEIRLFSSLAPQIATVVENRRQFEMAQRQAEREAMLNAISQKIQSATSVEAVLQIAARELGSALDASKAVAQLGMNIKIRDNGNGHHD